MRTGGKAFQIASVCVLIFLSACVKRVFIPFEKAEIWKSLESCEVELDRCVELCDEAVNP